MSNQTQTIARRYFEDIWNQRKLSVVDELVAANVIGHVASATIRGRDALKQRVDMLYNIYTQPHFTVEDLIAAGDKAVVRWTLTGTHSGEFMGAAPTGRQMRVTGMNIFRIADGQIAEAWINSDDLGELQQLGVLPMAQAA